MGLTLPLTRPFAPGPLRLGAGDYPAPPTAAVDSGGPVAICEAEKQYLQLFWEAISGVLRGAGRVHNLEADVSDRQSAEVDSDGRVIGLEIVFPVDFVSIELEGKGCRELRSTGARDVADICVY